MPQPQLFDQSGHRVTVGRQIGRRGGEGSVYQATSHPGHVVKLYHEAPSAEKADKLEHLCQLAAANPKLLTFAAWPTSVVSGGDRPRGFLMPLVKGKEIHQLFSPRERFTEFPAAGWDFLIHVARNCAAAFDSVHELGAVIGDVNEGNLLVTPEGLVRLIDCDSYQIQGSGLWTCDVGVPLWTPPELQGKSFRGLQRTPNHDVFGLAVLIFKILFMGRHPYAGIPVQQDVEFVLEKAIAGYSFAFSPQSESLGLRAPPHSLPMSTLPEEFRRRFEEAFLRGSQKSAARPVARDWALALENLLRGLTQCGREPAHKYPKGLSECPWCTIANAGGPVFFVTTVNGNAARAENPAAIWEAIARIDPLRITVPKADGYQLPPAKGRRPLFLFWRVKFTLVAGLILGIAGLALCLVDLFPGVAALLFALGLMFENRRSPRLEKEIVRRKEAVLEAFTQREQLVGELAEVSARYKTKFTGQRSELRDLAERYTRLGRVRQDEMKRLERTKHDLQLRDYLDRQLIAHANVPGIGPGRLAILQGYGIESALDLTPKMKVPGIGEAHVSRLLAWRRRCELGFRYDPATPVSPQAVHQLDARMKAVRDELITQLQQGPIVLTRLNSGVRARVLELEARLEANLKELAQTVADLELLQPK